MWAPLRLRVLMLGLLIALIGIGTPVQAAIGPIDPTKPPVQVLDKAEADKLAALQSFTTPVPVSDISPDDTTIFTGFLRGFSEVTGLGFVNITSGAVQPVDRPAFTSSLTREYRWLDNETLVYIGAERSVGPVLVTIDRASGEVSKRRLPLPGIPLTLSPGGRRVLLALEERDDQPTQQSMLASPFDDEVKLTLRGPGLPEEFTRPGPFNLDEGTLRASATRVNLAVLDLTSGQVTPLFELPAGTMPIAWAWSADSTRFALVRTTLIEGRAYRLNELVTQDVLGNLPPEKNPFLQRNVVDMVDFTTGAVRPAALRATENGDGDTFFNVEWAPDGRTLLTQMAAPSRLTGRAHPIYLFAFAERTYLRFYSPDGRLLNTFDSPDIEAPFPVPLFAAPDEVIVSAANGTDIGIFYYNRATGEFRRLPLPSGSTPNDAKVTRQTRQIVFSFSSFTQVPELFRINWDGGGLAALTYNNTELAKINQVRADAITFTLANGQQRAGYLIQPAGAASPLQNAPLIVWQEGGPTSTFSNAYGGIVERPFNLLPNFGQSILFVPLTGRQGFGVERYRALYNDRNFGQQDIDEMAEIVQQAIDRGLTSRGKVGITGCSYGGYFAAQSITRHPDLYAAANPQCTLLDVFIEWQFGSRSILTSYIMGAAATSDGQAYAADSPLYNANRVRAATLIFHGTDDFLPIALATTFHDQIQANGAAVNMYGFVREGHGLRAFSSQTSAAQFQIQWFRQYLGQ